LFIIFFFQAEDGIRDGHVTEFRRVLFRSYQQAIDLTPNNTDLKLDLADLYVRKGEFAQALSTLETIPPDRFPVSGIPLKAASLRSEERRVGKECRYRWSS